MLLRLKDQPRISATVGFPSNGLDYVFFEFQSETIYYI